MKRKNRRNATNANKSATCKMQLYNKQSICNQQLNYQNNLEPNSNLHHRYKESKAVPKNVQIKDITTKKRKFARKKQKQNQIKINSKTKKINLQQINQNEPQVSYREYCVVDDVFLPITSKQHYRCMQDWLQCTADTHFPTPVLSGSCTASIQNISFHKKQKPILQSTGIQYSQRLLSEQVSIPKPQLNQKVGQCSNSKEQANKDSQSLSELLSRLQSCLLPQRDLREIERHEKQQYVKIFKKIMNKMAISPRLIMSTIRQENLIGQSQLRDVNLQQRNNRELQELIKVEQLIRQIKMREYSQLNSIQGGQRSMSSVQSILKYTYELFCYIELYYTSEFLVHLKSIYGYPYRQKYQRITRNHNLIITSSVLQKKIFNQFHLYNQQADGELPFYQTVHQEAIFDCINQLLNCYRPFYKNKGDCFPWAVKLLTSISEFVIDQDSIDIIFGHIKDQIILISSSLCGLMPNVPAYIGCPITQPSSQLRVDALTERRNEKESVMISDWLKQQFNDVPETECFATQVMHMVSQSIYGQLLEEMWKQALLLE